MDILRQKYNLPPVFYIDAWPLSFPLLVVGDPAVAASVTQGPSLPKHWVIQFSLRGLVGTRSLFTHEGQEWRNLRSMFNPGFSLTQLMTQVSDVADHIAVFRQILSQHADTGETIRMGYAVTLLTMDVISEVVMGYNFDSQRAPHPIVDAFQSAISWTFEHTNLIAMAKGIPMMWWYTRRLDILLSQAISERYRKGGMKAGDKRAVIDIALQAYDANKVGAAKSSPMKELDPDSLKVAVDHSKLFILGGHDTTASTTSYSYLLLSQNPDVLQKVREEHDSVFDPDSTSTLEMLKKDPRRINSLPYTTAIIKETLRMYPPGSSFRMTEKGKETYLDYKGLKLPASNHGVWVVHFLFGKNEELFPDHLKFIPERFLAPNEIPKDAYRPFEKGNRNCQGQELAMLEMKMILLLTLRDFDFEPAYDAKAPKAPEEYGGSAYQMLEFSPKPAAGLPMKVKARGR